MPNSYIPVIRGGQKKTMIVEDINPDYNELGYDNNTGKHPEEEDDNLFILSVTLSNKKTYLVEVKKRQTPE